jgi:cerevisin
MHYILTALLAVPAVLATPLSTHSNPSSRQSQFTLAPLINSVPTPINNSYIVVLRDDVSPYQMLGHLDYLRDTHNSDPLVGVESGLKHIYDHTIKGYAGSFSESTIDKIRSQPEVEYVEQDQTVWASGPYEHQKGAPWVRFSPSNCQL